MRETVWGERDSLGWERQCGVGETVWGERDTMWGGWVVWGLDIFSVLINDKYMR